MEVGTIYYDPKIILGTGCNGTIVYRGTFGNRDVAVKRILREYISYAEKEVKILSEADDHPNVVRYYHMEEDLQFRYIALQLCSATLQEYIKKNLKDSYEISKLEMLRQTTKGLAYLHSLNIVHRDIKPHNILLSISTNGNSSRVMISDFGFSKKINDGRISFSNSNDKGTVGWTAPEIIKNERTTASVDIFSLGCVFYYMLTNGIHPFGEPFEREARIFSGSYDLSHLKSNISPEDVDLAMYLIKTMLELNPEKRPPADAVYNFPLFWNNQHILDFFLTVHDHLSKNRKKLLDNGALAVINGNWLNKIDSVVSQDLCQRGRYNGVSMTDLLRAIRNKKTHYIDSKEIQHILGSIPDEFTSYWLKRFPKLLLHIWLRIQMFRKEKMFIQYYVSNHEFDMNYIINEIGPLLENNSEQYLQSIQTTQLYFLTVENRHNNPFHDRELPSMSETPDEILNITETIEEQEQTNLSREIKTTLLNIMKDLPQEYYSENDKLKLSERLNNFPFALSLAVGYIKKENKRNEPKKCTIDNYITEIERNTKKLQNCRSEMDKYEFTIMITLMTTVDKLEDNGDVGIQAIRILEWIAYLKPDQIFTRAIFTVTNNALNQEAVRLLGEYAVVEIENLSWIPIVVQRVVQEVMRIKIKQCGYEERVLSEIIEILKEVSKEVLDEHIAAVWKIAYKYPDILKKHYYKSRTNPLMQIAKENNADIKIVKALLNFEYENKKGHIFREFHSFECNNFEIYKDVYDFLTNDCKLKFDLNRLLMDSLKSIKNKNIFEFLVSKGANVNFINKYNQTPIMIACENRNETAVQYLLSQDCDVGIKNKKGEDALLMACGKEFNDDVCTILIESDRFNLNKQGSGKNTPISRAYQYKNKKTVKLLLEHLRDDLNNIRNCFLYACYSDHIDILKRILEDETFRLNDKDSSGRSGLMSACEQNNIDIVRLLIKVKRINLSKRDALGKTAIFYACRNENTSVFDILNGTGKYDINSVDKAGWTLLMEACRYNSINIVRMLIEDIDLNIQNKSGETALMIACQFGSVGVVLLLVDDKRINFTVRDKNGKNTLYHAFKFGGPLPEILIKSYNYDLNEEYEEGDSFYVRGCKLGLYFE